MSTLLRLATAGSVDDGKSTLVGRLLHDTKSILADQISALERHTKSGTEGGFDLAALTDGLRAEREQGITIDVAYRYFATPTRTFILADCPGHVEYTRNTVTGSSTADVLVVLVDAQHGVVEQTRRHLAVAALLRVPHVIVAVNKIDLVADPRHAFESVERAAREVAAGLGIPDIHTVPVSALHGDNIVDQSTDTPWYPGPPLLSLLESLPAGDAAVTEPMRFTVQSAIRTQGSGGRPDFRGYAGQVTSGALRVGQQVVALPGGRTSTITALNVGTSSLDVADAGRSVTVQLADEVGLSRGDVIADAADVPTLTQTVAATLCWLDSRPLHPGARVLLKHRSRTVQARVNTIDSRLDLDTLGPRPAPTLDLNDIGDVSLTLATPLPIEDYSRSRAGGAFLIIDPSDGATLAAGMAHAPS